MDQLQPLKLSSTCGEPFLPLRRHKNIILTPLRWEDKPRIIELLNDMRISWWLRNPPYPYLPEHADSWLGQMIPQAESAFKMLQQAQGSDVLKTVDSTIVGAIREVSEDGRDTLYIGNINLTRCPCMELAGKGTDLEQKERLSKENDSRDPGDPEILWTPGYYLAPSHHRQGIMSDALETLLHDWAIPRMGVRKMLGGAYTGNEGSKITMEKAGFKVREIIENFTVVKGIPRSIVVLEWRPENAEAD